MMIFDPDAEFILGIEFKMCFKNKSHPQFGWFDWTVSLWTQPHNWNLSPAECLLFSFAHLAQSLKVCRESLAERVYLGQLHTDAKSNKLAFAFLSEQMKIKQSLIPTLEREHQELS